MSMIELYKTGRDELWGQGTYGRGQINAYQDKAGGNGYDDTVRYMSADYIAGYTQEWYRLTQLENQQSEL